MRRILIFFCASMLACSFAVQAQVSLSWTSRLSTNSQDSPRAIAVDADGNSYITGAFGEDQGRDIATIKYDSTGARVWTNTWGTAGVADYATDIEIDGAGSVYVYGAVDRQNLVLLKYTGSGVEQWVQRFSNSVTYHPAQMAIDSAGNIYLTAVAALSLQGQLPAPEFLTLKYDSTGALIWSRSYSVGQGFTVGEFLGAVAVDSSGHVYVTGASSQESTSSTFLLKYDADGNLLWNGGHQPSLPTHPRRIALDNAENIYVGMTGPTFSSYGLLVFKYDWAGQLLWSGTYKREDSLADYLVDIAVDASGNVYLTGGSPGGALYDIVTVKFTADGTRQWVSRYNNTLANLTDEARAIAVDSAGSVYVGGYTDGGASSYDFLILKYDANGNQKWAFTRNEAGEPDLPRDLALGPAGTVFLTGAAYYLDTGYDIFTLKLEQQTVHGLPEILAGPRDTDALIGRGDITFSVAVESATPVTYQWRFNGGNIPGATQQSYTIRSPGSIAAGEYSVRVANAVGVTATPEARLTLHRPATASIFTSTPHVIEGRTIVIESFSDGDLPIGFQWRFNGTDLVGQTNQELRLTAVTTNHTGSYALVVRNPWSESISTPIQISVSPRSAIERWTWLNPLPQGNALAAIAHGNGRYVAVGEEGTVIVSTNGHDWSAHGADYGDFTTIAFGNGVFVAFASPSLAYTSTDGVTWINRTSSSNPVHEVSRVVFGAGRFVALGNTLRSSADGISWIDHSTNAPFGGRPLLTYGNGIFFMNSSSKVLTSSNGLDWVRLPEGDRILLAVAAGNGVYVAHYYNQLFVSTNGSNWNLRIMRPGEYFEAVEFFDGQFFALGSILLTSSNGFNWTQRIPPRDAVLGLTSVAGIPGQTIVVGEEGIIFESSDGATFTQMGGGSLNDYCAIYENNRFTVAGNDGVLAYSYDGIHFAQIPVPGADNLRAIAFDSGSYVAVGEAGALLTSGDGFTWERLDVVTNDLYGVKFLNGHFIAVGGNGRVLVSTNARDWAVTYANVNERFQGIAYGAGRYVTTGQRGYYAVSTNASHWSPGANTNAGFLGSIIYTNNLFVAVGTNGQIFTSPQGVQWTQRFTSHGQQLESVIYVLGQFIAAGDRGTLMTSPNAIDWTEHRFLTRNSFRQIIYAHGALWGVGNNEMIVKSGQLQPYVTLGSGPLSGRLVQVLAEPGQVIELQASDNLSTWETLVRAPASAEGTFTHIDSVQRSRRFYRVAP